MIKDTLIENSDDFLVPNDLEIAYLSIAGILSVIGIFCVPGLVILPMIAIFMTFTVWFVGVIVLGPFLIYYVTLLSVDLLMRCLSCVKSV